MPSRTWFWSDTHFDHGKIMEYQPLRAFHCGKTVEEMNEWMVDMWNWCVQPNDDIWFLGDLILGKPGRATEIFARLHGRKHLVRGNHDGKEVGKLSWASQHDLIEIKEHKQRFVLCHYPLEVWNNANYGAIHLHGHSHGNGRKIPRRFDVGVDSFGSDGPVLAEKLIARGGQADMEYQPQDHHGRADVTR